MCNPFIWLSDKKKNDKLECKKELLDSKTVLILIFFLWIQVYNYFLAYMSSKFVFSERIIYIFVRFIVIYVYPKSLPQPPLFYCYFFIFLKRFTETRIYPFILMYMSTVFGQDVVWPFLRHSYMMKYQQLSFVWLFIMNRYTGIYNF